jgi:hypothetical protein
MRASTARRCSSARRKLSSERAGKIFPSASPLSILQEQKHPTRYVLSLLLLLHVSLALAADPAKEVKAAFDALNAAFEKHDAKTIRSLMSPDHVAISPMQESSG